MDKYLRQYAEAGTAILEKLPGREPWGQVVVIPVCNESAGILRPLPPAAGRSLMVLVVNQSGTAPHGVSEANRAFAAELNSRFKTNWQSPSASGLTLYEDPASPRDLLLVDRFSEGLRFPPKRGVGLARKTGADLAASLIHRGRVHSPWIHCSDADVRLPPRYFSASAGLTADLERETAALVYPFHHRFIDGEADQKKLLQATRLYEFSLRYYVAGLEYAGSPYAFHTIGSTMSVNAAHYAKVRGFPRREAGEDFYLLNKLAKVGKVRQLSSETDCEPIEIAARLSDRVPFGTGAAVGRIVEFANPAREFLLYHPAVFEMLRDWLESLPDLWQSRSCNPGAFLCPEERQGLIGGLEALGVAQALRHALRQSADASQFQRQMHTWFDAFRTLKLIHYLRDQQLPSISFDDLVKGQNIDHLLRHEAALPGLLKQCVTG